MPEVGEKELKAKDMKIDELMKQLEELTETNKKLQAQVEKLEDEKRILSEANIVLQGLGIFYHVINPQTYFRNSSLSVESSDDI